MFRVDMEWIAHAEHLWLTAGGRIEKPVMNKYDTAFLLLLIGAPRERWERRRTDYCERIRLS